MCAHAAERLWALTTAEDPKNVKKRQTKKTLPERFWIMSVLERKTDQLFENTEDQTLWVKRETEAAVPLIPHYLEDKGEWKKNLNWTLVRQGRGTVFGGISPHVIISMATQKQDCSTLSLDFYVLSLVPTGQRRRRRKGGDRMGGRTGRGQEQHSLLKM